MFLLLHFPVQLVETPRAHKSKNIIIQTLEMDVFMFGFFSGLSDSFIFSFDKFLLQFYSSVYYI